MAEFSVRKDKRPDDSEIVIFHGDGIGTAFQSEAKTDCDGGPLGLRRATRLNRKHVALFFTGGWLNNCGDSGS